MCRQNFIWHITCKHLSINVERCDQALSPFSTPLFCDKYQVVELATKSSRCRGLHCRNDPDSKWSEHDGPRVAQLSVDVQDLKDLIGARELECQFAIQRWYRGGPLQQTREEEHYVRLQEELTELRLEKYKLQLSIKRIEDFYDPAKNAMGFDRALYLAEFLKKKDRLTAAASRKNASIPLPTLGIPRFTPFVKMPDTSNNSTLFIPRIDSNHGTLKGYVAAIEPTNDSGIFTSWPSHHISLNHAAPNKSSNNASASTQLATANILVADEQIDVTPQSPTTRLRTSSDIAQPRTTEAASNLRSRPRGTSSTRRGVRQTSVKEITSSGTRRSGRLSGKGRKNYAESSSDETSLSPSQTILRQPASQNSRRTMVTNGSKRRKTAEDLDDDFTGDDEGRYFDLDPQDDEECGGSEPTPSKRPRNFNDDWHSPSVLQEGLSWGCKTGAVNSLQAAQKPSGLLSNPRILDALQKLQSQTDTAPTESSQSRKYGIAPMAPMYTPSSTIPSKATSPHLTVEFVDAQLPNLNFHAAPQYHNNHGTIASKDNNHHMSRMAGVGIPQIFLGQSGNQQPIEQTGLPGHFGPSVNEFSGGSFEDINFDDVINFGGEV